MSILSCSVPDCDKGGRLARGWCQMHYKRFKKYGDPMTAGPQLKQASCAVCGVSFATQRAKYCSRRCQELSPAKSSLTCRICGEAMVQGKTSKPQGEAAHDLCRLGEHGDKGYSRGCRCEECTAGHLARIKAYNKMRYERDGVSLRAQYGRVSRGVDPTAKVSCFICRKNLGYVRADAVRYPMHKKCRATAADWIKRGLDNPRRVKFQARIDKAAAGTSGGSRVFTSGPCPWCGEQFTGFSRHCSRRCATSAKYASRSRNTFKISPKERLKIYERDNWTCQLCNHAVDPALHYLHDWSATLDHIIPQSHMLVPDHSPSNLRLAHRWCNSARGDGSNMTEEAFDLRIAELRALAA